PLEDAFRGHFLLGTAPSIAVLRGQDPLAESLARIHFSAFTPENSMKPEALQRVRGQFTFQDADALVQMAEQSGAVAVGHTLVWHSQTPSWFFQNAQGQPLAREEALRNMRDHIAAVVGRYKGRVKQWDVVNEAISDGGDAILRDSPWRRAIGDDYIAEAFRAAHRADPDALLTYNDYGNESGPKRDKNLRLLKSLLDAGVPVHAVGLQCHWRLGSAPLEETEKSIGMYAALGLKVIVSELDIGVLPTRTQSADIAAREAGNAASNPYVAGLPAEVSEKLAQSYAQAFALFLRHKNVISRVTLWGTHDGVSWLNDFPIRGRTDYPLLFDRAGQPKAAFFAVQKAGREVK
ncbi:MAG TPA: endo-1,4-beta-xylanase, partial [Abditibacterium sp.]